MCQDVKHLITEDTYYYYSGENFGSNPNKKKITTASNKGRGKDSYCKQKMSAKCHKLSISGETAGGDHVGPGWARLAIECPPG